MSAQDKRYDDMTEGLATQRAADAEAWDAMPVTTHPRDVVGGDVDELNIVGVLSELGVPVGPIEFEGKEDFIRGDDVPACCRGLDILGAVPGQLGLKMGARGLVQQQAAGFVQKNLPGGKSYLAVALKPTAALDFKGSANKAQLVAKNAKMVAASLKNFKSAPPGKNRLVGGDVEWVDIVGSPIMTTDREWSIQGDDAPLLVGEAAQVFDDVVGARPVKKKASQISDNEVRALARDLEKSANKLSSDAGSFSKKIESKLAKNKALKAGALQAAKTSRAIALTRSPVKALTSGRAGALASPTFSKAGVTSAAGRPGAASKGLLSTILGAIGQLFPGGTEETVGPDGGYGDPAGGYGLDPYAGYTEPELPPGPPDYGLTAPTTLPPLVPNVDYLPDPYPNQAVDDPAVYDSSIKPLPLGVIYYENQKGRPDRYLGSANYYTGGGTGNTAGMVWKASVDTFAYTEGAKDRRVLPLPDSLYKNIPAISRNSIDRGWGPIVGNPAEGDWKGLRLDVGTGKPFWFRNSAPPWATTADDLDRQNKAMLDYQSSLTKAKSDYVQAVAQAKSRKEEADERARKWAKTQEDMQHQQQEFDQKQRQQMDTMDLQQMQSDAAMEQQLMQSQMQQEQQLSQLDIQRQQAETQAYQQWLQSGGAQGAPQEYYDEGGGYAGEPFSDLDQGQGGGSVGPFDDLSEGQVSDALSVYDEGQFNWGD